MFLKSLLAKLETESFKKKLKVLLTVAFLLYFFITMSSFAQWFPGSRKIFNFNTTSGLIFRIIASAIFIGSILIGFLAYRKEIRIRWFIVIGILMLLIIIFAFFTPTSYNVFYRTDLYSFMTELRMSVSIKTQVTMLLSFFIDLLFGLAFVFIIPVIYKDTKCYLLIMLVFLAVMLYSCFYSFIVERDYYKYFLSGKWEYQTESIGSIFGDKQQWGVFLAVAYACSFLSIYFLSKMNLKKVIKILSYSLILLTALLSFVCSVVCFCKTAIICNIVFTYIFLGGIIFNSFRCKKGRAISISIAAVLAMIIAVCIMFWKIPSLSSTSIGQIITKVFDTLEKSGESGANSRFEIMFSFLEKYPATNLMFGVPKGVLEDFEYSLTPTLINSLHTGIAIFFGRSGIIGLVLYAIFFGIALKNIIEILLEKPVYGAMFLGGIVASFIINLSEGEVLIMSSSFIVYVENLIFVSLPIKEGLERKAMYEKDLSVVSY